MSRSCIIPIHTIPTDLLVTHILNIAKANSIEVTEEIAYSIAFKADGHVRDAMQYLDFYAIAGERAIETPYELISEIILSILKKQPNEEFIKELSKYPTNIISPTISRFLSNCFLGRNSF